LQCDFLAIELEKLADFSEEQFFTPTRF